MVLASGPNMACKGNQQFCGLRVWDVLKVGWDPREMLCEEPLPHFPIAAPLLLSCFHTSRVDCLLVIVEKTLDVILSGRRHKCQ